MALMSLRISVRPVDGKKAPNTGLIVPCQRFAVLTILAMPRACFQAKVRTGK
jgi:hypothetical protein